jgi:predicted AlkP superfamily phosphohydrolase/phosphomutase
MLLVIGWDGASWNVLDPWLRQGRLPNLSRLLREGMIGPLRAPWPPVTLPSWTTFMTGVNPGRHGIFDFTLREPDAYRVRFVNATHRRVPTVWRRLSEAGRRICILGLPGTYPPEPVNGLLVSGFDTPVTTRADDSFVFPRSAAPLIRELGGFPFADFQEFVVDRGWYRMARERLLRGVEQKLSLARALLRREAWDCFLILFGESDTVSHHFWHFSDPHSPLHDPAGAAEFGETLYQVFARLDEALGELRSEVPQADVLLLSDHGFGGASGKLLHLNRYLADCGLLSFNSRREGLGLAPLKSWALRWVPARWQARLFRIGSHALAGAIESSARFAGIDFERTRAFSEESGTCPAVWLNVAGREPSGTIPAADYEKVREEVVAALTELKAPGSTAPAVARVWRREELYTGPCVGFAPDVLIELGCTAQGYTYNLASSRGRPGRAWTALDPNRWQGGKLAGLSGTHRQQGIYVVAGPRVRVSGVTAAARMEQIAPTLLSLCGVPYAPAFFDGETLCTGVSRTAGGSEADKFDPNTHRPYSLEEEAEVERRLRALGYLD